MSKQSKKQIKAQCMNEIAAQYRQRQAYWESRWKEFEPKYIKMKEERDEAVERARKAEAKLSEYEDWIQRLQDSCNMTDEDRQRAIEKDRMEFKHAQAMESYDKLMNSFFRRLF